MGWRDLLQTNSEEVIAPWVGGRSLRSFERFWNISGRLPQEFGWYSFEISARNAKLKSEAAPKNELLSNKVTGYLVGDRIILDTAFVDSDPSKIHLHSEPVFLIEPGLDRFARISAGRFFENGPLIYDSIQMPLGIEEDVLQHFLDNKTSINDIQGVIPGLDAAFRMEVFQREEAEKRRLELERLRREEEERIARENRRRELVERLGDGSTRRELAGIDFSESARAALAVGGAVYLDHRAAPARNEMIVRFRYMNRRFECVCDKNSLRIIDAGICLTDEETGEKGDNMFTLESLPSVIKEAIEAGVLVVFRHVG